MSTFCTGSVCIRARRERWRRRRWPRRSRPSGFSRRLLAVRNVGPRGSPRRLDALRRARARRARIRRGRCRERWPPGRRVDRRVGTDRRLLRAGSRAVGESRLRLRRRRRRLPGRSSVIGGGGSAAGVVPPHLDPAAAPPHRRTGGGCRPRHHDPGGRAGPGGGHGHGRQNPYPPVESAPSGVCARPSRRTSSRAGRRPAIASWSTARGRSGRRWATSSARGSGCGPRCSSAPWVACSSACGSSAPPLRDLRDQPMRGQADPGRIAPAAPLAPAAPRR